MHPSSLSPRMYEQLEETEPSVLFTSPTPTSSLQTTPNPIPPTSHMTTTKPRHLQSSLINLQNTLSLETFNSSLSTPKVFGISPTVGWTTLKTHTPHNTPNESPLKRRSHASSVHLDSFIISHGLYTYCPGGCIRRYSKKVSLSIGEVHLLDFKTSVWRVLSLYNSSPSLTPSLTHEDYTQLNPDLLLPITAASAIQPSLYGPPPTSSHVQFTTTLNGQDYLYMYGGFISTPLGANPNSRPSGEYGSSSGNLRTSAQGEKYLYRLPLVFGEDGGCLNTPGSARWVRIGEDGNGEGDAGGASTSTWPRPPAEAVYGKYSSPDLTLNDAGSVISANTGAQWSDKIITFGGLRLEGGTAVPNNEVWVYSPSANSMLRVAERGGEEARPSARFSSSGDVTTSVVARQAGGICAIGSSELGLACVTNTLVVYGGRTFDSSGRVRMLGDVWTLNLSSYRWQLQRTEPGVMFRAYQSLVASSNALLGSGEGNGRQEFFTFGGYRVVDTPNGSSGTLAYIYSDLMKGDVCASSGGVNSNSFNAAHSNGASNVDGASNVQLEGRSGFMSYNPLDNDYNDVDIRFQASMDYYNQSLVLYGGLFNSVEDVGEIMTINTSTYNVNDDNGGDGGRWKQTLTDGLASNDGGGGVSSSSSVYPSLRNMHVVIAVMLVFVVLFVIIFGVLRRTFSSDRERERVAVAEGRRRRRGGGGLTVEEIGMLKTVVFDENENFGEEEREGKGEGGDCEELNSEASMTLDADSDNANTNTPPSPPPPTTPSAPASAPSESEIDPSNTSIFNPSKKPIKSDTCPICIDQYTHNEPCRLLPCGHMFHPECVDNWLMRNGSCPTCREVCRRKQPCTDVDADGEGEGVEVVGGESGVTDSSVEGEIVVEGGEGGDANVNANASHDNVTANNANTANRRTTWNWRVLRVLRRNSQPLPTPVTTPAPLTEMGTGEIPSAPPANINNNGYANANTSVDEIGTEMTDIIVTDNNQRLAIAL